MVKEPKSVGLIGTIEVRKRKIYVLTSWMHGDKEFNSEIDAIRFLREYDGKHVDITINGES